MESITFTCKVITPMFLAGADGRTPELRAPSIKGAMRFWWRAMHGDLSLEDLRKQEAEIFGGRALEMDQGNRSRVLIKIIKHPVQTEVMPLVAHDSGKGRSEAFKAGQEYSFKVSYRSISNFSIEQLEALIQVTFTLGGLGRRQRRGMGASEIIKVNAQPSSQIELNSLLKMLNTVNSKFQIQKDSSGEYIQGNFPSKDYAEDYPFIKSVYIAKKSKTPYDISFATHEVKGVYQPEWKYGNAMGKPVEDGLRPPSLFRLFQTKKV